VTVRVKPPYGRGGIKDYLLGAYKVAPSILPDVATVDMGDIRTFAPLGIFQPLEELLPPESVEAFYPVARQGGMVDEHLLAIQFEADLFHLAYRQDLLKTPPPSTWEALLNSAITYETLIFSAEDEASDVVLLQYMASGGPLPYGEAPPLDEQVLLNMYNFYDQAYRRGVIPEESVLPLSEDNIWEALSEGKISLGDTRAQLYARKGIQQPHMAPAPIPTWDGKPKTLVQGWGMGITTGVPERRQAAVLFLQWLLDAETLGPWSEKAGYISTRRDVLKAWNAPPQYVDLLDRLLLGGQPYPAPADVSRLRHALAVGLHTLLVEGQAPEEAVRRTVESYGGP